MSRSRWLTPSTVRAKHPGPMASDLPAAAAGSMTLGGDMPVRRMGFGAMRITGQGIWGEPADRAGALRVLRRAVELGVTLIDTADSYGPEVSEKLIAEALHPYPAGLVIATKGGLTRQRARRMAPQRQARIPAPRLREEPEAAAGRPDRPLPAARHRLEGAAGEVGGRAGQAPPGREDPAPRSLQRQRGAAPARPGAGPHRERAEPVQPHRPSVGRGAGDLWQGGDWLPALVPAGNRLADQAWRTAGRGGPAPRRDESGRWPWPGCSTTRQ